MAGSRRPSRSSSPSVRTSMSSSPGSNSSGVTVNAVKSPGVPRCTGKVRPAAINLTVELLMVSGLTSPEKSIDTRAFRGTD